ncbi:protein Pry1p [[Candida] jaroonii]|uniref:Protein Pry1p n=1 Tax=[Candida] jaroonii TaxID=467808 RepID=A0ACA9Y7Z2_9ASCO|nr:protein Pry1p [[Candida] jaroonii]
MKLSLIVLVSIATKINGAPAPEVATVWQTATNVVNDDGSIFTFLNALFDDTPDSTTAVAVQATPVTAAAAAAAATTTAAASSSSGSKFSLDSFLSTNINKWLNFFGLDDSSSSSSSAAAAAAPVATSAADTAFPNFTFPNKASSAVATTPASTAAYTPATTTSTSSTAAATSSSSSSGGSVGGSDVAFASAILKAHNTYRAQHDTPALSWNQGAYEYAQNNADNYDCSGILTHTHGQYGENLAAGFKDGPSAVKAWYDEGETYNYQSANTYDHFTQVVWKGSTGVGCAYKDCSAENWGLYIVCEYDPPGNVIGKNAANVLPVSS